MRSYSPTFKTSANDPMQEFWDPLLSACFKFLWLAIAIFAPIGPVFLTVFLAVFADTITGCWAAKKRGEAITSSGLRRTVSKILIYFIVIGTGYLLDTYLIGSLSPVVKLTGAYIGIVEFTSILENSSAILGQNIFQILIKKLGSSNDKEGPKK